MICGCNLSRRELLAGAAALGVGGAAAGQPAARDIVDVHAHFTPPQYIRDLASTKLLQPVSLAWTVERHLAEMDAAGVARSLLSVTTPGVSLGDVATNRRMARYVNDYAAELVAAHPRRLGQFTALPIPDVEGSLREIAYGLDQHKAQGVCMFTSYAGRWLGDSSFDPIFEELNRRKAVVYVHPTSPQCCTATLPYLPDAIIEYGVDTTRAIANYVYSGAAQRYPDVKVIWSHAGGVMPFLIERFDVSDRGFVKGRTAHGFREAISHFFFDTAQASNAVAMRALSSVVPTERIVFGTDYPFRTMRDHVAALEAGKVFTRPQLQGIYRSNVALQLPALLA